jgi:hypothetical protein
MSAVTTVNSLGHVRRYDDGSELRAFHIEQKPQPMDSERVELVAADKEVCVLLTLAQHLEVSDIGFSRILEALRVIQRALDAKRLRLGLNRVSAEIVGPPARPVTYAEAVADVHAALGLDQRERRA